MTNYILANFEQIDVEKCPCGYAQRAFVGPDNHTATFHIVQITANAKTHYHKEHTEIYYVLDGTGSLVLDDSVVPLKPGQAVLIKPLCRH